MFNPMSDGPVLNRGTFPVPMFFLLLIGLTMFIIAAGTAAAAENTPPSVEIDMPVEGAQLGLTVAISGEATDTEGFNVSSTVEARWNDWEWFELPSTPAGAGKKLSYGEDVQLLWHAPREHVLTVRAFDGELYSEEVSITVTVRDLPDLVILPTDIAFTEDEVKGGEDADVQVTVRNEGGEDLEDVVVVLRLEDRQVGKTTVGSIPAHGTAVVEFTVAVEVGNMTLLATANVKGQVQERSQANNDAQQTFQILEDVDEIPDWQRTVFVLVVSGIFLVMILGPRAWYQLKNESRKT